MATIATLSAKLMLDAANFVLGIKESTGETGKLEATQGKAERSAKKLAAQMEMANKTFGMSAAQARIYKIEKAGASAATIKHLKALDAENERMKKQEASTARMNAGLKNIAIGLAAVGAAAVIAGVAMTTALVSRSIDMIDNTADLADRLGTSTESLQRLRHAADMTASSGAVLDSSIEKMNKNLADAARGTGTAAGALSRMGMDAKELASVSPDEALLRIADGMSKVETAGERASLSAEILGKSGVELAIMLAQGRAEIEATGEQANLLGLVFTRMDAEKVAKAKDSMDLLGKVIDGIGIRLAIELSPYITAVATNLLELGTTGEGMGAKVSGAFEWIVNGIGKAADWINYIKATWHGFMTVVKTGLTALVMPLDMIGEAITWITNKLTGARDVWPNLSQELAGEVRRSAEAAGDAYNKYLDGAGSQAVSQTLSKIRDDADKAAEAIGKLRGNASSELIDPTKEKQFAEALGKIREELENIGKTEIEIKLLGLAKIKDDAESLAKARADLIAIDQAKQERGTADKQADAMKRLNLELARAGMNAQEREIFDYALLGFAGERLEEIAGQLKSIDILTKQAAANDTAEKSIKDLQDKIKNFGLDELDQTVMQMLEDGADAGKIEAYIAAFEKLKSLEEGKKPVGEQEAPRLTLAGSAEAQRLSYLAGRPTPGSGQNIEQKQLTVQERIAKGIDRLNENMRPPEPIQEVEL